MHTKESVISKDDCAKIIKSYLKTSDFQVLNYEVKPFSNTVDGFMGEYLLIIINYLFNETAKEANFFAKRFPFHLEFHTRYAKSVGAFTNEIFTYEVIFNKFSEFDGFDLDIAPKYYFGKADDILVFENLSERGFVVPSAPNSLSLEHIKLTLEALAKYHAGSIWYQELRSKEIGEKYELLDEYSEFMQEPLFRNDEKFLGYGWFGARLSALKAIVDLLPPIEECTKEEFKEKLSKFALTSFDIIKPSKKFYNVLCHGDMWGKNVMFRYVDDKPIECKLIDFQLQRYCPPAHDVLQFIYLTTTTEERKNHLHELLIYYHDCLRSDLLRGNLNADDILSISDFEVSVAYLLPQIKLQTAYYLSFQGANSDFHKRVTSNVELFKEFCFQDGAPFSIDLFKTDPNYKRLMTGSLDELKYQILYPRISLEDCFRIVKNKLKTTDFNLVDYSYKPLKDMGGYLGDHYKLTINVTRNDKFECLRLFAKCSPVSETLNKLAISSSAFVKEAFVMYQLLPLIQSNGIKEINECFVPSHLARINDLIIFDDIEFQNYRSISPRVCYTYDELKLVIEKLVIFHASSIIIEEKLSRNNKPFRLGEKFQHLFEEPFFRFDDAAISKCMKIAHETISHEIDYFDEFSSQLNGDNFKRKVDVVREVGYERLNPSNKFRNVICHGDLWSGNIMVKHENNKPVDCFIIDYQILRYCPPAHDLLCLLYLTTGRHGRAQYMNKLIDYYYKQFCNILRNYDIDPETIYTYEEFLKSVKYAEPQAIHQSVLYYQVITVDPKLMKESTKSEEDVNKIFLGYRGDFVVDMYNRDPIYRERNREILQDLHDLCLKHF